MSARSSGGSGPAIPPPGRGEGIFIQLGTLTLDSSSLSGNSASTSGGGIYNYRGTVTVENSSSITGNIAPVGFGADVYNQGVLHVDASSIIGILDGNPATIPLWGTAKR